MAIDITTFKEAFPNVDFKKGDTVSVNSESYTIGDNDEVSETKPAGDDVEKLSTPAKWDAPEDARKAEGAGKYPNYYMNRSRSGHVFMMDDSKGAESVTLQHRSGSMLQMLPDGKVNMTTQNGKYEIVFGYNRIRITGSNDITVNGSASLRVDGDYNITVARNMNVTVEGDYTLTTKNLKQTVRDNAVLTAKTMTSSILNAVKIESVLGSMSLLSSTAWIAGSATSSAALTAANQVAINADQGEVMIRGLRKVSIFSQASDVAIQALTGKFSVYALRSALNSIATSTIESLGSVNINSGLGTDIYSAFEVTVQSSALTTISSAGATYLQGGTAVGIGAGAALNMYSTGAMNIGSAATLDMSSPVTKVSGTASFDLFGAAIKTTIPGISIPSGAVAASPGTPIAPFAFTPLLDTPSLPDNPKQMLVIQPNPVTTQSASSDLSAFNNIGVASIPFVA
jgi:hypothetical protein